VTLFEKIILREIPAEIVWEDDDVLAPVLGERPGLALGIGLHERRGGEGGPGGSAQRGV